MQKDEMIARKRGSKTKKKKKMKEKEINDE